MAHVALGSSPPVRPHSAQSATRPRRRRFGPARLVVTAAAVIAVTAPLAGCGANQPAASDADAVDDASATVIDNCGFELTVDAPPERVVTIKSTATEMMLALGLADRLVGTAFSDGPVPDEYADELDDVPVVSDQAPGQEALLDVEPDFVYAGWESNFAADTAGDRDTLAELGVGTYVSPAACQDPAYQPNPMTFEELFDEIRELAGIFDVADRAEALIAEQQDLLDSVDKPGEGLTALWYSSGEDQPYVGANIGAPAMIMRELGLENIFADVEATWSSVNWEQVIDREPDVIVLVDAIWNSADQKVDRLESNPVTAELRAVREGRYLRIPFPAGEAGVRNAQAVVDLAEQLDGLGLAGGTS